MTYFAPYKATTYSCARCHEQFMAIEEFILYHDLKSTIQGKSCPTCQALLRESLVEEQVPPFLPEARRAFDEMMSIKGYDVFEDIDDQYIDLYNLAT